MEESRLDRVRINVAGGTVEISQRERGLLLQELCLVPGCKTLREAFAMAGASTPVDLGHAQRTQLRAALEVWSGDCLLPDGLARLLTALARADLGHK